MEAVKYVIFRALYYLIEAVEFAMLIRAVMSWLPLDNDNAIDKFVTAITEPFIYPVRLLLERFESLQRIPIDISFFVTYLLLFILSSLLSTYGRI